MDTKLLNLSEDSKVLLLGAYKGRDAVRLYKQYGCTIYAVEPSNFAFSKLIKASIGRRIIPLKLAVGEKNGLVDFYEYGYLFRGGEGNSLFGKRHKHPARWGRLLRNPHSNPELWLRKKYKVLSLNIKTLLNYLGLNYIEAVICDCEGAEKYLIDQLIEESKLANRFDKLVIELHPQIYEEKLKCQLVNKMSKYFRIKYEDKKGHILFAKN